MDEVFDRYASSDFHPEEEQFLAYQAMVGRRDGTCHRHRLLSKWTSGGMTIAGLRVDGFCPYCKTIYM